MGGGENQIKTGPKFKYGRKEAGIGTNLGEKQ